MADSSSIDIENLREHLDRPCPFESSEPTCKECPLGEECLDVVKRKTKHEGGECVVEGGSGPTPEQKDFDALVEFATEKSDSYKEEVVGGVQIHQRRIDSTTYMGRATVAVPSTAEQALRAFWDLDSRKEWDMFFNEMKVVKNFKDCDKPFEIVYMAIRTPPLIAPRDFVQARSRKITDDGAYAAVFLPYEHDSAPTRSGYVRGTVHFSGIYVVDNPAVADEDPSCSFTMVSHTNFGVPIPEWLLGRLIKMGAGLYFGAMQKALAVVKKHDMGET